MKKLFFTLLAAGVLSSCGKENGNKSVLKADSLTQSENPTQVEEQQYRYVAEDGSNANVTFTISEKGNTITILSNGKTIRAEQTESNDKETIYKTHDIEIKSQGDSLTILQGNAVIELKKARGQ